jgi:hypothetical protein
MKKAAPGAVVDHFLEKSKQLFFFIDLCFLYQLKEVDLDEEKKKKRKKKTPQKQVLQGMRDWRM